MEALGTIDKLWRYPVKSLLGESCTELEIDRRGVIGDRWYAISNSQGKFGSGKNTRRFRKIEGLFDFQAEYFQEKYDRYIPLLTFPDGRIFRGDDSNLDRELSTILRQPVTLVAEKNISHFDADSLHLVTTASLRWLRNCLPDSIIDERRFRPNFLIDLPGVELIEHDWLGKTITVGQELKIEITSPTERCVMTSFAQQELPSDRAITKTIAKKSRHNFGVYAKVIQSGTVRLGDRLYWG